MQKAYGKDVEFLLVYIREAHAIDSPLPMEYGMVEDPTTDAERVALARTCTAEMKVDMPAVVDGIDDAVNHAYSAWPERLYLVGIDGKIAYAGGPGPFLFAPDELDAAIRTELGDMSGQK